MDKAYQVAELKGIRSVRALQVCSTLLLGMLMLPINLNKKFDEFFKDIAKLPVDDQRKVLRDAVKLVALGDDEINACLAFCKDKNGVPIDKSNIENYPPGVIAEMVVSVCLSVLATEVFF